MLEIRKIGVLFCVMLFVAQCIGCENRGTVCGEVKKVEHFPSTTGYAEKTILSFTNNKCYTIIGLFDFDIGVNVVCKKGECVQVDKLSREEIEKNQRGY